MTLHRRSFLSLSALAGASLLTAAWPAISQEIDVDAILNDPEAPTAGNLKGDVTIVAFLDYNCPFCKKTAPDLERIVKTDGKIRLVYKDWPILSESSVDGAQLALGAHYQGRYEVAHKALMNMRGRNASAEEMQRALKTAGVDMARLKADLEKHGEKIQALLRRNMAQAEALGINGTPAYLIGPYRTTTLDYEGFKQVVADARASQAGQE